MDSIVVVDADGRVFGAGWNCDGQATGALSPPPFAPWTRVPLPVAIRSVAVGQRHALALDAGGTVWAWGGATGGGRPAAVLGPATSHPSSSVVTAIAAGGRHSLAATHAPHAVLAWGDNLRGQCGAAACGEVATPTPIPTLAGVGVVALGAGAAHSVAVTAAGQALAWGAGVALGREEATDDAPRDDCTPSAVDGGGLADVDLVSVSTGAHHTVAVDSCGGAWVWGTVGGGRDAAGAPPRRIAHGATAAVAGWWHGLVVMRAKGSVVNEKECSIVCGMF